jgi:DNA-binding transcriptional LysR family regulator
MRLTLDALRVLDAIDRRGSFAAAADELHRVTSALSYSVHKLEDDLGIVLFEKQGKRSALTAAGRSLLDDGRRLLQAAEEVERRARRVATGWEAELHIAVDTLLPLAALTDLLHEFDAIECGTQLQLHEEVFGGGWDALASGRCDLAIGAPGDMPSGGGYQVRELLRLDMVFCVAPTHPLAEAREPVSEAELEQYRAIVIADSSRLLIARTSNLLHAQPRLVVPDLAAKRHCQVAGLGVGSIPRPLAELEAARGRLVMKELEVEPSPVLLHLAWRNDNEGQALRWFVDALQQRPIDWQLFYGTL